VSNRSVRSIWPSVSGPSLDVLTLWHTIRVARFPVIPEALALVDRARGGEDDRPLGDEACPPDGREGLGEREDGGVVLDDEDRARATEQAEGSAAYLQSSGR
jgi:hypothetical protein